MNEFQNSWTFSGEIFYLKELEGEFAVSIKLRGQSKRMGSMSAQIAELSCIAQKDFFDRFKEAGLGMYKSATLSGHIEYWQSTIHGKPARKMMLIADSIIP